MTKYHLTINVESYNEHGDTITHHVSSIPMDDYQQAISCAKHSHAALKAMLWDSYNVGVKSEYRRCMHRERPCI